MSTNEPESRNPRENTQGIEIHAATPNLVSFRSPNRMYYLLRDGNILALCLTKEIAQILAKSLE